MLLRLSKWRPAHLLLAWCAYWLALPLLLIAPALPYVYRLSKPGSHGTASVSYADGAFHFSIEAAGLATWTHSVSSTAVLLAIAIPPLLLWALWLRAHRHDRVRGGAPPV